MKKRESAPALAPAMPILLNRGEAARALGISHAYLKLLDLRGEGPPRYEFGRRKLYSPSDLAAFARKHRRGGEGDE